MVDVDGLSDIDRAILRVITREREKYGACTARQIARALGYNNSWISAKLANLKTIGLVDFDPLIPGSIRHTGMIEVRRADYVAMLGSTAVPEPVQEPIVVADPAPVAKVVAKKVGGTKKAPATKR